MMAYEDKMQLGERLREYVEGTCIGIETALDLMDEEVSTEDALESLLDIGIELCDGCDHWMESGELVNDDGEVVGCSQCRGGDDD